MEVSVCVRVSQKILHLIKLEGIPFQLKHVRRRRKDGREGGMNAGGEQS